MDTLLNAIEDSARQTRGRYFGKYRAFVVDTADPSNLGRLKLTVPSVLGEATSDWALPCVPYGGGAEFGFLAIPPVGAQVLAEFMEGDASSPLWVGAFWRAADEMPKDPTSGKGGKPEVKLLKTESGHVLAFDDTSGGEVITLTSAKSAVMVMDETGSIVLTDQAGSKVTLDAEAQEIVIEDASGNSIKLSASGITCTDASGNQITTAGSGVTVKSSAVISIEGSMVAVAGSGGEPLIKGATFLSMFNTHIHGTAAPGAPTTPPIVPLTPAVLTTKSTAQ
jgi:Type VI secretion system/phage-baseplate injector OB domain